MTIGEAKAYLSLTDEANLENHYDEFLFKQKEFFRQRPISKRIYTNQFIKIEQAIVAYEKLGFISRNIHLEFAETTFGNEIKQIFNLYHLTKNQLYHFLYSAESLINIILIGSQLINLETKYAFCFNTVNFSDSQLTLPDPMNVLKDINELNEIGIQFIHQLDVNKHSDFVYLFSEINRVKRAVS
jgi:hypothetical protein